MELEFQKKEAYEVAPGWDAERSWFRWKGEEWCCIMGRENHGTATTPDLRWHISLSMTKHQGTNDVPIWRDFVALVHHLRPGVPFVIGIPPANMWMNLNPNVLHAWETRDETLIRHWRDGAALVAGTERAIPS